MTNIRSTRWYQRAKTVALNPIPRNERINSIFFFLIFSSIFIYMVSLQMNNSDFYTAKYGTTEMIAQYSFLAVWIITALLEGILGKRFASRSFDVFGGIFVTVIASLWLAVIFPYDFNFFAELMPSFIAPLFGWINNSIGEIILYLVFTFHLIALFISPFAYKFVKIEDLQNIFRK